MEIKSKEIKIVDIHSVRPNPENPNRHSKEQIDRLVKILKHQGFRSPLTVSNQSGFIVVGHGRLEAAKKVGFAEVPVIFQDFASPQDEYLHLVADNSMHSDWAELDLSLINTKIPEIGPFDIDLLGLKDFQIEVADKYGAEDEVIEPPKEAKTRLGDLYQLGPHRLLCGDSTQITDVERLMGGERADLWLTDPPYGVGYRSNGAENKHEKIANDDLPLEEMSEFWAACAANALIVCSDKSAYYWFACQGGDQMMMMMSISRAGWKVRHELIWVKDSMVMGRCDYHYKHEPILYGWKQDGTHEWMSDRKQTSVLEFARPKRSEEHPTMKPVDLVAYLIGNNTSQNQIVFDTFGGSGTTLIAAEKTNRQARLLELSPIYCDVIVERYLKFSKRNDVILNGQPYSPILAP